ncbi:unnamed protein product [Pleuronectes platessa]|uniref:Uncharacterized protein n=1 Tax=Pleuronectes platessa TaxID=8262 RepID=A0A9N7UCX7_PLEPL|nr:unnamed protein product [Pleuronectes platessa]
MESANPATPRPGNLASSERRRELEGVSMLKVHYKACSTRPVHRALRALLLSSRIEDRATNPSCQCPASITSTPELGHAFSCSPGHVGPPVSADCCAKSQGMDMLPLAPDPSGCKEVPPMLARVVPSPVPVVLSPIGNSHQRQWAAYQETTAPGWGLLGEEESPCSPVKLPDAEGGVEWKNEAGLKQIAASGETCGLRLNRAINQRTDTERERAGE